VDVTDVAYFFALEKAVYLRTLQGNTYPLDFTLDKLENMINPSVFYRINRKYIVHIESIRNMVAWSRSRVKLELNHKADDEMETIVSIDRAADFKKWLNA
jgi:DNA-binding LytR/AlgR family response regulator